MKNFTKFIGIALICAIHLLPIPMSSQCNPPPVENCEEAYAVCGLAELNGYCCTTVEYNNPTGCNPLCPSGGAPSKTNWWAFITNGGQISISINFNNCSINGQGLQMGIWGDCNCNESLACNSTCGGPSNYSISASLASCKIYYLFINGCNGDVCDFCLNTTGGLPPNLPSLGNIQGMRDVCVGACSIKYSVNVNGGACNPYYDWTIDGNKVGSGSNMIAFDFPKEGDFILCATAYIGNPGFGNICDQEGPVCITIRARYIPDKVGPPWLLCPHAIPFKWHSQWVTGSGHYSNQFTDRVSCCVFDSVREFIVLDVPEMPEVFHLGCNIFDAYVDPTTRQSFNNCQVGRPILLKRSSMPYMCDSSYLLNATFLNHALTFREYCDSGKLYLEPRIIDQTVTCDFNNELSQEYSIRWYLKSDSTKKTIDLADQLLLTRKDSYCIEVFVDASYGMISKKCSFTFCEQLDEDEFFVYEICPEGDFILKPGDSVYYTIDTTLHPQTTAQQWTIEGGRILTPNAGKDTNDIVVIWDQAAAERFLCYQYVSTCGESKKCCQEVKIISSDKDILQLIDDVMIIPNPASHSFHLWMKLDLEIIALNLYDQLGQQRKNWIRPLSRDFEILDLPSGIYFLRIQTNHGELVKKIVLSH
ncbi:MAG: T9SS type A sorting domain-containing protein [Saprospiraceae bacterium]|nr:T9SS type A sorting domain-containing protein [Saprospiraceae bacterium]